MRPSFFILYVFHNEALAAAALLQSMQTACHIGFSSSVSAPCVPARVVHWTCSAPKPQIIVCDDGCAFRWNA